MKRSRFAYFAVPVLVLSGLAFAQGIQPGFIRNLVGPVAISGDVTASGDITADHFHSTAGGTENAFNMAQDAHLVFNDPTATVYMDYNGTNLEAVGAPISAAGGAVAPTFKSNVMDAGTLVVTGPATLGSTAIPTCNAASERRFIVDASTGGTSGAETKLCMCTSDGAGSPTFSWYSILPVIAKGNASACP